MQMGVISKGTGCMQNLPSPHQKHLDICKQAKSHGRSSGDPLEVAWEWGRLTTEWRLVDPRPDTRLPRFHLLPIPLSHRLLFILIPYLLALFSGWEVQDLYGDRIRYQNPGLCRRSQLPPGPCSFLLFLLSYGSLHVCAEIYSTMLDLNIASFSSSSWCFFFFFFLLWFSPVGMNWYFVKE